jgi:hypothetical protein
MWLECGSTKAAPKFDPASGSAEDPSELHSPANRKISGYATDAINATRVANQRLSGRIARIFGGTGDFIPFTSVIQ